MTSMSLVYMLYALMTFQGVILLLHFTGKGYIISLTLEVAHLFMRVLLHVFHSCLKWILPQQRKSIRGELALVTGAASGIGRLIALHLAEKGKSS